MYLNSTSQTDAFLLFEFLPYPKHIKIGRFCRMFILFRKWLHLVHCDTQSTSIVRAQGNHFCLDPNNYECGTSVAAIESKKEMCVFSVLLSYLLDEINSNVIFL